MPSRVILPSWSCSQTEIHYALEKAKRYKSVCSNKLMKKAACKMSYWLPNAKNQPANWAIRQNYSRCTATDKFPSTLSTLNSPLSTYILYNKVCFPCIFAWLLSRRKIFWKFSWKYFGGSEKVCTFALAFAQFFPGAAWERVLWVIYITEKK